MPKRKLPNRPCVMLIAQHIAEIHPCKHCSTPTDVLMESWIDVNYRFELQERGTNPEYAAQLALAASIRHQSKQDSQPFDSAYLCKQHLLESTRRALNLTNFSSILPMYAQFTKDTKYIIFDKNEEDTSTQPKLTVGPYDDIWHFLKVYEELGQP